MAASPLFVVIDEQSRLIQQGWQIRHAQHAHRLCCSAMGSVTSSITIFFDALAEPGSVVVIEHAMTLEELHGGTSDRAQRLLVVFESRSKRGGTG